MTVFHTFKIDSTDIIYPNDFTPERAPMYAGEYTSCTGKLFADLVGWKYADMTLEWGMLPTSQVRFLIGLSGEHSITFTDIDGVAHTEAFVPTSQVAIRNRQTKPDGTQVWHDISLSISFTGAAHAENES